MTEFFETCASGPVLPASVLLTLVCIYWLTVIVGAVGMDAFDFDLDFDFAFFGGIIFDDIISLRPFSPFFFRF